MSQRNPDGPPNSEAPSGGVAPTLAPSYGTLSRLGWLMFLEYFVQGAYMPVATRYLEGYLGFSAWHLGLFGAAIALGALVAPFISGQVVDRYFASERFLAVSHLAAGIVMLLIARTEDSNTLLALVFLYSLLYVPTMSVANTLCFRNMRRVEREFPIVRVFGTIGFIAALWAFEMFWLSGFASEYQLAARADAFTLSGLGSLVLAGYALTLPHTPPIRDVDVSARFAPGRAFGMLRNRAFLVLFLTSLPIAIVHKYYFVWTSPFLKTVGVPEDWIGRVMSVGQIFEILVMLVLGPMLAWLGFKWTLSAGIAAQAARFAIFALEPSLPVIVFAQMLHGVCFACFYAAAFMLADRLAPRDARASVQTFFNIFLLGVGSFLGGFFAGGVGEYFTGPDDQKAYGGIWLAAAAVATVSLVGFVLTFPKKPLPDDESP